MNTIIEKIRAEVNRMKPRIRKICGEEVKIPVEKVREKFDTLLSILSDLEKEEKPSEGLEEEIKSFALGFYQDNENLPMVADIARHFYELGRQSNPKVCEGLEEEISRYLREDCSDDDEPSISEVARHFAKWQADKDLGKISRAYENGATFGMTKQKELMMKEAVEGEIENPCFGIVYLRKNLLNEGYSDGEKVRIIICKKED